MNKAVTSMISYEVKEMVLMKKVNYLFIVILVLGIVVTGCSKIKEEANTGENHTNQIVESENESLKQTDNKEIPTIDTDTAEQISINESEAVTQATDTIIINLQDITTSKLTLYCENTDEERAALEKICFMEFINGRWVEMKRISDKPYELPATVIPAKGSVQVDFEYESLYGEIDKGEYICVIEINGEQYQYEFVIE